MGVKIFRRQFQNPLITFLGLFKIILTAGYVCQSQQSGNIIFVQQNRLFKINFGIGSLSFFKRQCSQYHPDFIRHRSQLFGPDGRRPGFVILSAFKIKPPQIIKDDGFVFIGLRQPLQLFNCHAAVALAVAHCPVCLGFDIIPVNLQRLAPINAGLLKFSQRLTDKPHLIVRFFNVRLQCQRFFKTLQSLYRLVVQLERKGKIVIKRRAGRSLPNRLIKQAASFVLHPFGLGNQPQKIQDFRLLGRRFQNPAVNLFCFVELSGFMQLHSPLKQKFV